MFSKIDNMQIMIHDEADKFIEGLLKLKLICFRYQTCLKTITKGSDCIFNYTDLLY